MLIQIFWIPFCEQKKTTKNKKTDQVWEWRAIMTKKNRRLDLNHVGCLYLVKGIVI